MAVAITSHHQAGIEPGTGLFCQLNYAALCLACRRMQALIWSG